MPKRIDPPPVQNTTQPERTPGTPICPVTPAVSLRAGMICPRCGQAIIDYDGLLNLSCPQCGMMETGACT